jgi:hypothetical protein
MLRVGESESQYTQTGSDFQGERMRGVLTSAEVKPFLPFSVVESKFRPDWRAEDLRRGPKILKGLLLNCIFSVAVCFHFLVGGEF